jgi:nucleoid DNA-binding protein
MNPKKANKLYKQVAEEMDLSETLVEDFIEFYYKAVRANMSDLTHHRINVEGLGQFVVKHNLVRKAIPKYTKSLKNHDTSTFRAYYNKKMVETKLDLLIKLEQKISDQEIKKENIKSKKHEDKS